MIDSGSNWFLQQAVDIRPLVQPPSPTQFDSLAQKWRKFIWSDCHLIGGQAGGKPDAVLGRPSNFE